MNKKETAIILTALTTAYPRIYSNLSEQRLKEVNLLWSSMFINEPYELVQYALKRIIETSKFAPTIAEVKEEIKLAMGNDKNLASDYWNKLVYALSDCNYHSSERFLELPSPVKRFVGSPNALKELGQIETAILNTVTRSNFLKVIDGLIKSEEESALMPKVLKELAEKLTLKIGIEGVRE